MYIHCNSHILNLSLGTSIKTQIIDNVLSLKREGLLEHVCLPNSHISGKRIILIGLCKTRWSERDAACEPFYSAFNYIVESLEVNNGTHPNLQDLEQIYANGWDLQYRKDVTSYPKGICDFSFIIGLLSLYTLLYPVHATTVRFQASSLHIMKAHEEISEVINDLIFMRTNIVSEFA